MGKVSKVKTVKTKIGVDENVKVKKLAKNSGVSKPNAVSKTLNLKDARVPLMQLLKDKKSLKLKPVKSIAKDESVVKKESAPVTKTLKRKSSSDVIKKPKKVVENEAVPLMKTLKRTSTTENLVKPPLAKKKIVTTAKKTTDVANKTESEEKPKVRKKEAENEKEGPRTKQKKSKLMVKLNLNIDVEQLKEGISAVLKLAKLEAESNKKKKLFSGDNEPIFLQVSCIKVPKVPKRIIRMMVPHSLVADTDEVVFFSTDFVQGHRKDFESTINHHKDLLAEHGCTQIKDIIPLTQLKTEYGQYELKRKLSSSYDFFLSDSRIAGHVFHILGNAFKRKIPNPVRMSSKDLKLEVSNALRKTKMHLHSHGDTHTIHVAHTAMTEEEILENIISVCKSLANVYPGGWANIRNLILKTATSLAVPIYITLKSKNKVKVPVIKAPRPKAYRTVVGELSTASSDTQVHVQPDGTVLVEKLSKNKSYKPEEQAPIDEILIKKKSIPITEKVALIKSKLANKNTAVPKSVKSDKKPKIVKDEKKISKTVVSKKVKGEKKILKKNKSQGLPIKRNAEEFKDDSETKSTVKNSGESEEEIEEAEQAYLNRLQRESSTTTTGGKKIINKKKSKIVKKKKTKL